MNSRSIDQVKFETKTVKLVSIASRVVPAMSNNKRSLPIKALIKLDFPALGRPTTAKRGKTTSSELVLVLPETHQLMHPTNSCSTSRNTGKGIIFP
jgi:hypothetical protein